MDKVLLHSTFLNSVIYDPVSFTLDVELKDGSVYRYSGITEEIYSNLLHSPSKGKYYRSVIWKFPHIRIR